MHFISFPGQKGDRHLTSVPRLFHAGRRIHFISFPGQKGDRHLTSVPRRFHAGRRIHFISFPGQKRDRHLTSVPRRFHAGGRIHFISFPGQKGDRHLTSVPRLFHAGGYILSLSQDRRETEGRQKGDRHLTSVPMKNLSRSDWSVRCFWEAVAAGISTSTANRISSGSASVQSSGQTGRQFRDAVTLLPQSQSANGVYCSQLKRNVFDKSAAYLQIRCLV